MSDKNCYSCLHQETDTPDFIFETEYWRIHLNKEQSYLGRCVVVLKTHKETLSELDDNEWLDFKKVVKVLERSLKKSFNATMFNWSCFMNGGYKQNPPNPHVHWHVRPRYDHSIEFDSEIYCDPDFGHHYSRDRKVNVDDNRMKRIVERIKQSI